MASRDDRDRTDAGRDDAPDRTAPFDPLLRTATSPGRPAAALAAAAPPMLAERYRLEGVLGAGGMGVVHRAYDERLRRRVAIKLVRGGGDHVRLLREARTMAQIGHPGVVPVHDVLEDADGAIHVVMELIDGGTLGAWLREAPRPWREVLAHFATAGQALAAAHTAGIVHRDFKPENVLLARSGRVLVTDFGLARSGGDAATDTAAPALELTRTGVVLGTPAYMAPEQFASAPADARSDQFAFCVAVWEGLFGVRPFEDAPGELATSAATPLDRLARLRSRVLAGERRAPPPRHPVPARIVRALARGLAVEPARRWPDLPALLAELEAAARGAPGRRQLALAAGVLALAGGIAVGWAAQHATPRTPAAAPPLPWRVARAETVVELPLGQADRAALRHDGTFLATYDGAALRVTPAAEQTTIALPAGELAIDVTVGADDTPYVITSRAGAAHARPVLHGGATGAAVALRTGIPATPGARPRVAIGPGAASLAVAGDDALVFQVGEAPRWRRPGARGEAVAIAPDGRHLALATHAGATLVIEVLATADGAPLGRIELGPHEDVALAWLDDDLLVAAGSEGHTIYELRAAAAWQPRVLRAGDGRPVALTASRQGVVVARGHQRRQLLRGGVRLTPPAIEVARPVRTAQPPRDVVGLTVDDAVVVTSGADGAALQLVDATGQMRNLLAPGQRCAAVGWWRDQPLCTTPVADGIALRTTGGTPLAALPVTGAAPVACRGDRCVAVTWHDGAAALYELTPAAARALGQPVDDDWTATPAGAVALAPGGAIAVAGCGDTLTVIADGTARALALGAGHIACGVAWVDDATLLVATLPAALHVRLELRDARTAAVRAALDLDTTVTHSLVAAPAPGGVRFALVGVDATLQVERLTLTRD